MSYPDSVRYLYSLGNEIKAGAKFGLERMQTILAALDHPERSSRFVHVAGTNGKGSTSAMVGTALQHAGFRTGLYTSPHLIEPTERIQINGVPVTDEEFAQAFAIVHAKVEELLKMDALDAHPSYFETVTAMAFLVFKERAEVTVLEVGLGGRLDATNVVTPELCVITPVAYDHEAFLGNTLASIAAEKAGILKARVPVVIARQPPEAEEVILRRADELGCDVIRSADYTPSDIYCDRHGSAFTLEGDRFTCALAGRHQIDNAVSAVLACKRLALPTAAIQTGLESVRWPGRLEYISTHPDFILDGAHNPAGATALAAYIREFCSARPVWLVYGAMRDKAVEEVAGQLFPLADRVIVTAPAQTRALRPEAILQIMPHPNGIIAERVQDAIELARGAPANAVVFFTGSLFLVGEARGQVIRKIGL
ncbi:MAG TPA: folylpolyglutamate synthase/dihydrofolate synthase family protein [Bryobacteraceae bacterium]|nr:folylpolyglutamate synthase/dihydrofolate synthase family protein [Bryobacteraceae bacterium]